MSLFGNTLVIVVLMQKKNRRFTTSIYITSLAVADLLVNCVSGLLNWAVANVQIIAVTYSTLDCQVRATFLIMIRCVAIWMLAVISVERAICVLIPHTVRVFCTLHIAKCICISVWLIAFCYGAAHSSMIGAYPLVYFGTLDCRYRREFHEFVLKYFYTIYSLTVFHIPYFTILVCTVVILAVLIRRKISHTANMSRAKHQRSVTVALLIVNIVFLLTLGQKAAFNYLTEIWGILGSPRTLDDYQLKVVLVNGTITLRDTNSVVNVFIYFLSGTNFRKTAIELVCYWRRSKVTKSSVRI